jgi:hypothetical protein
VVLPRCPTQFAGSTALAIAVWDHAPILGSRGRIRADQPASGPQKCRATCLLRHTVNFTGKPKHKKVRTILSVRAAAAVQPRQDSSRVKACSAGSVWSTASVWPESVLVRAAACAALLSLAAAAAAVAEAGDGAVEVRAPKPSRMVRCGGIVGLLRASRHTSARHSLTS